MERQTTVKKLFLLISIFIVGIFSLIILNLFFTNLTSRIDNKSSNLESKITIAEFIVTDYYSLEAIDGKKAFYVIGSNIYGPMGEELIPFKNENEAKKFNQDHFGKKILKFEEIKKEMLF